MYCSDTEINSELGNTITYSCVCV